MQSEIPFEQLLHQYAGRNLGCGLANPVDRTSLKLIQLDPYGLSLSQV